MNNLPPIGWEAGPWLVTKRKGRSALTHEHRRTRKARNRERESSLHRMWRHDPALHGGSKRRALRTLQARFSQGYRGQQGPQSGAETGAGESRSGNQALAIAGQAGLAFAGRIRRPVGAKPDVLCRVHAEGEVYNGGFHQYFGNSSGDFYTDAVCGLEEIGAAECQRILIAAKLLLFGEHEVPDTKAARFEYLDLEEMEPVREDELVALDRALLAEGARLRDLLLQYAHKHRLFEEF